MRKPKEPRDLGQIEPYMGRWTWPCREMEIGDAFTVDPEDKAIGGVRAAVASAGYRMGKKFSTVMDGEMIRVTSVPMDAQLTAADANEARVHLVGGDGDKYLGVLQPPLDGRRWAWPFKRMEPGQYFHVAHCDRHPGEAQQLAFVRADTLGFKIATNRDDPELPGHLRIEYVDRTKEKVNRDLEVNVADQLGMRWYGKMFYDFEYQNLQNNVGASMFHACKQIEKPRFNAFVMKDYNGLADFYFELSEDGVKITSIPKGMSVEAYERLTSDEREAEAAKVQQEHDLEAANREANRKRGEPIFMGKPEIDPFS